ncbi:MAG: hypothetical protein WCB14_13910, partial [Candidatus Acidiferrales bacterium]
IKGRAEFARGDANGGRRGRANSALPYNGIDNGGAERQARPYTATAGELTSSCVGYTNAARVGLLSTTHD